MKYTRALYPGACLAAVDGWLDLAKLVTSAGNSGKTAFDELASSIGALHTMHPCAVT